MKTHYEIQKCVVADGYFSQLVEVKTYADGSHYCVDTSVRGDNRAHVLRILRKMLRDATALTRRGERA